MAARRKPRRRRIRRVANPTRYARETGTRLPRWRETLAAYEAAGGYFVHFSDFPKFGINPSNKYDTPTGFYAYPLHFGRIVRFANERPYAIVFRPRAARLWNLSDYSRADYRADLARLEDAFPDFTKGEREDWQAAARVKTTGGFMWNITRMLAGKRVARWTRVLYSVLGYDGVVDDCGGVIHPNEKCQAVFFDLRQLELVDILHKGGSDELQENRKLMLARADLSGEDLRGRSFRHANLYGANLRDANLHNADMSRANARNADLRGANLSLAYLSEANLRGADLSSADLTKATLYDADLRGAKLRDAILVDVGLDGANAGTADFTGAVIGPDEMPPVGWRKANGVLRRA